MSEAFETISLVLEEQSAGWTFTINDGDPVGYFPTPGAAQDAAYEELESHLAEAVKEQLGLN